MQLVECVPNFSEGRREDVIAAIRDAASATPGVAILDLHTDATHNRTVLTMVGAPNAVAEAAFRCAARAGALIDLREHRGQHPRIGATDVIPFVPVSEVSMDDCVELAVRLGRRLGEELGLPVYLYAEAARRPERRWLPEVRRGQYEGLREAIRTDPARIPDFGPPQLGPAGATAVGARRLLVAYNVNLATSALLIARAIARSVRESSGGLPAVQARGMLTADPEVVQVSTNLLDTEITPLHVLFEAIRTLAAEHGVDIAGSEIVGLVPLSVVAATAGHYVKTSGFGAAQVLQSRMLDRLLVGAEKSG